MQVKAKLTIDGVERLCFIKNGFFVADATHGVVAHEFMHTLGAVHSSWAWDVMYWDALTGLYLEHHDHGNEEEITRRLNWPSD